MKSLMSLTLLAAILMGCGVAQAGKCASSCSKACCATVDVEVYGSARHRLEIDARSFDPDHSASWLQYMRTRLGVNASRGNTGMTFEVQDSRVLGEDPGTFSFSNGQNSLSVIPVYDDVTDELTDIMISSRRNDFGVRQAYLWYKPCDKGHIQVGRFGVDLHNQRLIGQVDWHNIGRTTEGLFLKRKLGDEVVFIGSALQVAENNALTEDGDKIVDPMFYIADLHFPNYNVDLFFYLWKNEAAADLKLMTFGAYSKRGFGSNMWYDSMFAVQSGSDDDLDYSGMLANVEVGMKLDGGTKVSALFDYTTGDDAGTDGEVETFNNLLYTGHKWHGFMDYFLGSRPEGLTDFALRVAHPINETMWVKADGHLFKSSEEFAVPGTTTDETSSSLGTELDLSVVKQAGDLKLQGGFSFFSANEDWVGPEAETSATWAYLQSSFGF